MIRLRDLSIRKKLVLLAVSSAGVALLLSCAGFVANDVTTLQANKVHKFHSHAEVIGFNSTAVLTFHDARAAGRLLESLRVQPEIEYGCLFDTRGEILATYHRDPRTQAPRLPASLEESNRFNHDGHLVIVHPVVDDGNPVGGVYLYVSMDELRRQLWDYAKIATAVMFVSMAMSLLFSMHMQRSVSSPILDLVAAAQRISAALDYTVRVVPKSKDELGTLFSSFNHMLDQIQAAQVAIQEANAAKSAFLANMSHEIRTPMTAILGYADVLREKASNPESLEAVSIIQRNGEHLLEIINGILDLSKIEAGKLEVERIPCSPAQIVGDVVSLMRTRAKAKNLSLDVEFQGTIPETVQTDPTRLRQILINLVGNAIKFTAAGSIRVVVRMDERPGHTPLLCCDVVDTGIGLNQDQIDKVFEPFTQADFSTTRRFGGTGLGLTISKRLAHMLGGRLTVRSQAGQGSTFTASVDAGPLTNVQRLSAPSEAILEKAPPNPVYPTVHLQGRVLLAEDGPDNQRLISLLLKKVGLEVVIAENGQIACDLALAHQHPAHGEDPRPFDLILMDIQMPVLDGYHATENLRKAGHQGPIVALTAHAMRSDQQRCMDAGFDDYATKPINRADFFAMLQRHLSPRPAETPR
jgi:signal transduction histidine kinase/ActR/RegA family two-component response regulator